MKRLSGYTWASWPWKIPPVKDKGSPSGQGTLSALPSSTELMGSATDWQKDRGEYRDVTNPRLNSSDTTERDSTSSSQDSNRLRPVWIRLETQLPLWHSIKCSYYHLINHLTTCNSPKTFPVWGKDEASPKSVQHWEHSGQKWDVPVPKYLPEIYKWSGRAHWQQPASEHTKAGHSSGAGGNEPYTGNRSKPPFCTGPVTTTSCVLVLQLAHLLTPQDTHSLLREHLAWARLQIL